MSSPYRRIYATAESSIRFHEKELRQFWPRRNSNPAARAAVKHCIAKIREWQQWERDQIRWAVKEAEAREV